MTNANIMIYFNQGVQLRARAKKDTFCVYLGSFLSLNDRKERKMINLNKLTTEQRNENSTDLDLISSFDIINLMNEENRDLPDALAPELEKISKIVEWAKESINNGARIIYMGAGTSGRLGVLDAVECPPTFGVSPDVVVGLIAGGKNAFLKAVEGAEDSKELGETDLIKLNLKKEDLVIGIAASGRTPYVIGGLTYATSVGCHTATISCNKDSEISKFAQIAIEAVVGPEILTGSTRLKAGTVQKMILNMITTATFVGVGKTYQNLMVDVMQTNEKLRLRAENIIMEACDVSRVISSSTLIDAKGSVKHAIIMILNNCNYDHAKEILKVSKGHIR